METIDNNELVIGMQVWSLGRPRGHQQASLTSGTVVGDLALGPGPQGVRWQNGNTNYDIYHLYATEEAAQAAADQHNERAAVLRAQHATRTRRSYRGGSEADRLLGVDYTSRYDNND